MGLPILETPMHSTVLPSSEQRVEFRPFLVGEQKVLMIAQESDDQNTQIREMIRLINVCCDDVNAEKLPTVDLEWLFLQIRIKSVGETSNVTMDCADCGVKNDVVVDLESTQVIQEEDVSNIVKLTDTISLQLTWATYEAMKGLDITDENTKTKDAFILMNRCITAVISGDEVMTRDDFSEKELLTFIDSMSIEMLEGVQEYLGSAPILQIETGYKCKGCEKQEEVKLEGIGNFFA
ncbi:uncharacterized protein METZ01_LOCUS203126 [marine metagenome]|uniref:Baseplate protein n=1 Tax=marine metagenome TaxID=408172 RepID=A0A382EIX2_9ZZZZ